MEELEFQQYPADSSAYTFHYNKFLLINNSFIVHFLINQDIYICQSDFWSSWNEQCDHTKLPDSYPKTK